MCFDGKHSKLEVSEAPRIPLQDYSSAFGKLKLVLVQYPSRTSYPGGNVFCKTSLFDILNTRSISHSGVPGSGGGIGGAAAAAAPMSPPSASSELLKQSLNRQLRTRISREEGKSATNTQI